MQTGPAARNHPVSDQGYSIRRAGVGARAPAAPRAQPLAGGSGAAGRRAAGGRQPGAKGRATRTPRSLHGERIARRRSGLLGGRAEGTRERDGGPDPRLESSSLVRGRRDPRGRVPREQHVNRRGEGQAADWNQPGRRGIDESQPIARPDRAPAPTALASSLADPLQDPHSDALCGVNGELADAARARARRPGAARCCWPPPRRSRWACGSGRSRARRAARGIRSAREEPA